MCMLDANTCAAPPHKEAKSTEARLAWLGPAAVLPMVPPPPTPSLTPPSAPPPPTDELVHYVGLWGVVWPAGVAHVLRGVEVLERQAGQEVAGVHEARHRPHAPAGGGCQHVADVLELGHLQLGWSGGGSRGATSRGARGERSIVCWRARRGWGGGGGTPVAQVAAGALAQGRLREGGTACPPSRHDAPVRLQPAPQSYTLPDPGQE